MITLRMTAVTLRPIVVSLPLVPPGEFPAQTKQEQSLGLVAKIKTFSTPLKGHTRKLLCLACEVMILPRWPDHLKTDARKALISKVTKSANALTFGAS